MITIATTPEPDRERLAFHEVERVHAVPLEARPGGRVDHQQAERADHEGQHEQQDVDVLRADWPRSRSGAESPRSRR